MINVDSCFMVAEIHVDIWVVISGQFSLVGKIKNCFIYVLLQLLALVRWKLKSTTIFPPSIQVAYILLFKPDFRSRPLCQI